MEECKSDAVSAVTLRMDPWSAAVTVWIAALHISAVEVAVEVVEVEVGRS